MKSKKLVIERSFKASIDKVWDAFTTPAMLAKWWSPEGMTNSFATTDVCVGGEFRYCMKNSEGQEYWGKGVYQTITRPTYFSYIDNFTDANGKPVPPSHYGMPGDKLTSTLIEITLTKNGDNTTMNITMENPFDDAITESMTQGWNSMFDKLQQTLKMKS